MPPKKESNAAAAAGSKGGASGKAAGGEKGSKSSGGGGSSRSSGRTEKPAEIDVDEGIQAVWLLDDFGQPGLAPLTLDKPLGLLPIAGIPAVEYGLEFLARECVTEVILFARRHVGELKEYLAASRWKAHLWHPGAAADSVVTASPRIRVVTSPRCMTAGDALRFVDDSALVRSDVVVLLDGIVVSNASLVVPIASHTARNKEDSNSIITVLVRPFAAGALEPSSPPCAFVPLAEQNRLAIDPHDGRIAAYDLVPASDPKMFAAPSARALSECPRAVLRTDLYDTRIYVCSPAVLVHFSDNYDYKHVRQEYLHNEIQNVDLGFRFHAHVVENAFCAPVADLRTLDRVTKAVMQGWAAPLLPYAAWHHADAGIPGVSAEWLAPRPGVYVHSTASIHPSANITGRVLIGRHASVDAGAKVSGAIIGEGAKLGACAQMQRSILERGAEVGPRASLIASYLGADAAVAADVALGANTVAGARVKLSSPTKPFSRVTCTARPKDDFDEDEESEVATESHIVSAGESDVGVVGASGIGRGWPSTAERAVAWGGDDEDEEDAGTLSSDADPQQLLGSAEAAAKLAHGAISRYHSSSGADVAEASRALSALEAVSALVKATIVAGALDATVLESAAVARRTMLSIPALAAAASRPQAAASAAPRSNEELARERFERGLRELLPPRDTAIEESQMRHITLEVKSFKYAENRTVGDVVRVCLPYVLDRLARPSVSGGKVTLVALLNDMRAALTLWTPILRSADDAVDDQLAGILTLQDYCLNPANAADFKPIFGLVLQTMWELDLASDVAVSAWAEGAEESDDAAVRELRESKWVVRLLAQLDEDDEDEEEGDDDDEEEEEEDDA